MIDYVTSEDYALYNPDIKPSRQRNAGRMQTKTYRVRDAHEEFFPGSKTIHKLENITEKIVLIEVFKRLAGSGRAGLYWECETVGLYRFATLKLTRREKSDKMSPAGFARTSNDNIALESPAQKRGEQWKKHIRLQC